MITKTHVRRGELVEVIAGTKAGKRGRVVKILPKNNRVQIEGVVSVVRHLKFNRQTNQGGRVTQEGSVALSNVLPVCLKCDKPVRSQVAKNDQGRRVKVCRKCQAPIERG